jgi:hypothetical protein
MKRTIIVDGCIGCKLYYSSEYVCLVKDERLEDCPCLICLVKGMCATSCPDYKIVCEESKKCHVTTAI